MSLFTTIIGWVGSFLVVLGYYLVSTKRVSGTSRTYQMLNVFGAVGVGVNVLYQHAWPSLALQGIWIVIALVSLYKHRGK